MEGWMDGRIGKGGEMVEWMDGWTDEWVDRSIDFRGDIK